MNKKKYVRPKIREHIPVTPFELYLTGISGSADNENKEPGSDWDPVKRRGSFYLDDTSQETGSLYQSQYENYY